MVLACVHIYAHAGGNTSMCTCGDGFRMLSSMVFDLIVLREGSLH